MTKKFGFLNRIFLCVGFLFLVCFISPVYVMADTGSFCSASDDLTGKVTDILIVPDDAKGDVMQGLCIAEDYLIVTHWRSSAMETTFLIYSLSDFSLVNTFSYPTLHSNSMAYNPARQEVAVASAAGAGKIFLFHFSGGAMSYKGTVSFSHNIVGIGYSGVSNKYYLSTGRYVWETVDFASYNRIFGISSHGLTQGMGCDGEHLYVCWSSEAKQSIVCYSLTGQHLMTYTIAGSACREVEDVDFRDGTMYIGDNTAGPDTVHTVGPEHSFAFTKEIKPTCEEPGEEISTCSRCGTQTSRFIEPLGHQYGKWKILRKSTCTKHGKKEHVCKRCKKHEKASLPIDVDAHNKGEIVEIPAECELSGRRVMWCKDCHRTLLWEEIPALGHDFVLKGSLRDATVISPGQSVYECTRCGCTKVKSSAKQEPVCRVTDRKVSLAMFSVRASLVSCRANDRLVSCSTNKFWVAYYDGKNIRSFLPGTAVLTFETEHGAKVEQTVYVGKGQ